MGDDEDTILKWTVVVTCVLSVVGTLLIFISYAVWHDIRATSRKLLLYLSLCDFITALFYLIAVLVGRDRLVDDLHGDASPTTFCVIQSFLTSFSSISSFLWTASIGVFLFLTLVRGNTQAALDSVTWMHVACWGCPAVVVSIAAGFGVLGYDTNITVGWCWVTRTHNNSTNLFWRIFVGKGWEIASYIATPVLYVLVKRSMAREQRGEGRHLLTRTAKSAGSEADRKLAFVPLVFVLLRIWGTIRFILEISSPHTHSPFALHELQAIGDCSQGFANAVLFCLFTKKVRDHFVDALRSLCGGGKKRGYAAIEVNEDATERKAVTNAWAEIMPSSR